MQIDLSPQAEATLSALASSGGATPDQVVELAIIEMAERREPLPDQFVEPGSQEVFGTEGVRRRIAEADEAIVSGQVGTLNLNQALADAIQRKAARDSAAD
ncbi:MAG: hypothetical protein O2820_23010 [Planctomycetota bacterium]|nr:hypothetical protein [Planctomycetota bacterium]MDA1252088.1 hypothetical protein [Planctomycetota bacterium]